MTRLLVAALLLSVAPGQCGTGEYVAEVKRTFSTAQGLPSDQTHCIAVSQPAVFAGTERGLAAYVHGEWRMEPGFDRNPVEVCVAAGPLVLFTYDGGLFRITQERIERVATMPPGRPRSLAANGNAVYVASDKGLYRRADGGAEWTRLPLPVENADLRQIAVAPGGEMAIAAAQGLFTDGASGAWTPMYPKDGHRSWAPVDVRGVTYDAEGRLWFVSPQGAGRLDGKIWTLFTGAEGLPYTDFTMATEGERGVVWFATKFGAIRYDGKNWEYRQGQRWLPDDDVAGISVSPGGDAWFATKKGVGLIERKATTLAAKAKFFEDEIDRFHRRTPYGYVMSVRLPEAGNKSKWVQEDSDNDGLWTSMYGAGECFAFASTKDPVARQRARKAFEALRFLSLVTQGGQHPAPPGYPARAILPGDGPDPNLKDSQERNLKMRANNDHQWKLLSPRWPKSADGQWYWKADTSSDELDGHYFFYAQYYDLVAQTDQEKEDVRKVVRSITDHLIDHHYTLVDWDGTPTRWGHFDPATLNDNRLSWAERGLNSLSILSYLKVAEHMTGDSRYTRAYAELVREGKYAMNAMVPKIGTGPGSGNQSDDEMAFMDFHSILKYEKDPDLQQRYAYSLSNYWATERLERNPLFNFIAAASLKGKTFTDAFQAKDLTPHGPWLEESIDTLRRLPMDRIDWSHDNSRRSDVVPLGSYYPLDDGRDLSSLRDGKALPVDERFFEFWNHNPYRLHSGRAGHRLGDGAVFLLPYYMGLYYGYLEN